MFSCVIYSATQLPKINIDRKIELTQQNQKYDDHMP